MSRSMQHVHSGTSGHIDEMFFKGVVLGDRMLQNQAELLVFCLAQDSLRRGKNVLRVSGIAPSCYELE